MELELLNLELQLIETWAAGGTFVTTAETSSLNITGAVLRTDRTRLVLPLWSGPGGPMRHVAVRRRQVDHGGAGHAGIDLGV